MVTPAADRTLVLLGGHRYTLARDAKGARMYSVTPRASQPGDPGGLMFRDWTPWGHDLTSAETAEGFLGREYGDGTDGRWGNIGSPIGVDTLGPQLNTLTLSTYDAGVHAADLLSSTFILGSSTGLLGGAVVVANAMGMASMKAQGVTYGYIGRGQVPAKILESTMALQPNPPSFQSAVTDVIATKSALATTRNEVAMALGDAYAYQTVSEWNVGTADGWATNSGGEPATIFGKTPSSIAVLTGTTVKQNILTGAVTMGAPNLATVSTLTNEDVTFTGFALDGNFWVVMTSRGPYMVDDDTGEFTPLIPELDNNSENGRHAMHWFALGTVIPLRDGVRFQKALQGQSWGVERFLGNSSPVQGYPTGGDASTKWLVQALYNEVTNVTWLVAWRPRQQGDQHSNPLSPYVIGKVPGNAVSRFVDYAGYANGERTLPAWVAGNGSNALWWIDGRTSRFIDDPLYRYIAAGTTYGSELYLNGVLADVEAVEFLTANCTLDRTFTPKLSTDGGTSYVSLATQTTNGFHRVLAVSGGAPLASLQGVYRLKPAWDYAIQQAAAYAHALTPAPSGEWKLGESSGNALDTSGNGNNGAVTLGAGSRATAALDSGGDGGLTFDGAAIGGTLVSIADAPAIQNIWDGGGALWMLFNCANLTSPSGGNERLASKNTTISPWSFDLGNNGQFTIRVGFTTTTGVWNAGNGGTIVVGHTYAVGLSYDSGAVANAPIVYLYDLTTNTVSTPAVAQVTAPVGTRVTDATLPLVVGNVTGTNRTFFGEIDEVRLWKGTQPTQAQFQAWAQDAATTYRSLSPQLVSKVRVYWRWRPLEVNDYTWTFDLQDQPNGQSAAEQQTTLLALNGSVPVLVEEDQDNQSYYVRVNAVEVKERADLGGNAQGGERNTRRVAEVKATTWAVA